MTSWSATFSAYAQLASGAVRCWGLGYAGQLGVNATVDVGDGPGEMPPMSALLYPNPVPGP